MSVFSSGARQKADRIAAVVGAIAFIAGIIAVIFGAVTPSEVLAGGTTTVASSPVPGDPVTMTVLTTEPPIRPTNPPIVTQEVTTTEGGAPGTIVTTTTSPTSVARSWFLGSRAADIALQVILVTIAAFLLAWVTRRMLLGEYGVRPTAGSGAALSVVDEDEATAVKEDVGASGEAADLSRVLFENVGVIDTRLRLVQSRIALELEVRKLAGNNDLPSGLTIAYVTRGLVDKKRMTPKLATAVTKLSSIGDRLSRGAEISLDTTTLLTEAYAQALAKVGGKIR